MSPRLILGNREPISLLPGESVLAALRRNGVHTLFACEEGYCQACILRTDAQIPPGAQRGLTRELRTTGAFLSCQWQPAEDVRIFLPGEFLGNTKTGNKIP